MNLIGIGKQKNDAIIEVMHILMNSDFKSQQIFNKLIEYEESKNPNKTLIIPTISDIQEILKYDYFLAPLEGIYINENITKLLNFLENKMNEDSVKFKINHVDKLYYDHNSVIIDILTKYNEKIKPINNYKILYLFGNYDNPTRDLNCYHQYKIYEDTKSFINNIVV